MDSERDPGTEIALNVTRTRLTVLVFNMTVITFMLSTLKGRAVSDDSLLMTHAASSVALFVGFCLTVIGIFWLLHSQNLDPQGLSRPLPFTLGTITAYLALSQTITAFMHEYLLELESVVDASRAGIAENSRTLVHLPALGDAALWILLAMGSGIWVLTTYLAPLFVGLRSRLRSERKWILAGHYVALQVPIYWVYANAWHLQYVPADQPSNMLSLFALQLVQPVLWFR